MKTTIKNLLGAIIFATVLFAGTANASDHKRVASGHENIEETSLELENWMTDDSIWNSIEMDFAADTEAGLAVEKWMTNESTWKFNRFEVTDTENDLAVEEWMTNDSFWK